MKEKGWSMSSSRTATFRAPFFRDLKQSFWFGDKDEWARTYWNAYNYISTELEGDGLINPNMRHKETVRAIKTSLRAMNPVAFFSEDAKGREISKKEDFYRFLRKKDKAKWKEAKDLEKEYQYRLRKFLSEVEKNKHRKRFSIYAGKDFAPYVPGIFGKF